MRCTKDLSAVDKKSLNWQTTKSTTDGYYTHNSTHNCIILVLLMTASKFKF